VLERESEVNFLCTVEWVEKQDKREEEEKKPKTENPNIKQNPQHIYEYSYSKYNTICALSTCSSKSVLLHLPWTMEM
jgi:hypothetical protein